MAIKQERILALLAEADFLYRLHHALCTRLTQLAKLARASPDYTKDDVCNLLENMLTFQVHIPWEAHVVERYHFDREARRNTKQKERMRHRRSFHLFNPTELSTDRRIRTGEYIGKPRASRPSYTGIVPSADGPADYLIEEQVFARALEEAEAKDTLLFAAASVEEEGPISDDIPTTKPITKP